MEATEGYPAAGESISGPETRIRQGCMSLDLLYHCMSQEKAGGQNETSISWMFRGS